MQRLGDQPGEFADGTPILPVRADLVVEGQPPQQEEPGDEAAGVRTSYHAILLRKPQLVFSVVVHGLACRRFHREVQMTV
jgi:hypothetical protein